MKTLIRTISLSFVCLSLFAGAAVAQEKPLYQRLGGYDTIAAFTDDFLSKLMADKKIVRLFGGISTDTNKRLRQLLVQYFCAKTGGPCFYTGRSMKRAHAGLGMTKDDWQRAGSYMGQSLTKFKVPQSTQKDFFALLAPLEKDIVDSGS
jgi:hemoglobin